MQAISNHHNNHRSNHSAPGQTLLRTSEKTRVYAHNTQPGGGGYDQTIGTGIAPDFIPHLITNRMYNDEIDLFPLPYGDAQPNMINFESWANFCLIVLEINQ